MSWSAFATALLAPVALAAPTVHLHATVDDDLRTVRGTLHVPHATAWTWIDPLAALDEPTHELTRLRTYPHRHNAGHVRFEQQGGVVSFETVLPERFGDLGATRGQLFANGAWYPQPLEDGTPPIVTWDVSLTVPADVTGVVGDAVGAGTVQWHRTAERVPIAALRRATVRTLDTHAGHVQVIHRGTRMKRAWRKHLPDQLEQATPDGHQWRGVLVEAPLRRRVARAGPGLAYVSDHSWRILPWYQHVHRVSVVETLMTAWMDQPDPLARELGAAALSHRHQRDDEVDTGPHPRRQSHRVVMDDVALDDPALSFRRELYHGVHPTDPIQDDLVERYGQRTHGRVVAAILANRHGHDALHTLGDAVADGASLDEAAEEAGIPVADIWAWHRPYPKQDYRLEVRRDHIAVHRDAPADAPSEPVVLSVDGHRHVYESGVGPGTLTHVPDGHHGRVLLDPDHHLGQVSRTREVHPMRVHFALSGALKRVNISQRFVEASGSARIRRSDDTHNEALVGIATDQRDLLRSELGYRRWFGPRLRAAIRRYNLWATFENTWLNPRFVPLNGRPYAFGAEIGFATDNRVFSLFPTRGHRVEIRSNAGFRPDTGEDWWSVQGHAVGLAALTPRHVLAGMVITGYADTELAHRRLEFAGFDGIRGLPDQLVQTETMGIVRAEYRAIALRNAAIPLGLAWASDLQVTLGAEAGVGLTDGQRVAAVGVVSTIGMTVEHLGVMPAAAFVYLGWAPWTSGIAGNYQPVQVGIGWGQSF